MNRKINDLTLSALRDEIRTLIACNLPEPAEGCTHRELLDTFRPLIDCNHRTVTRAWKMDKDDDAFPYVQANLLLYIYLIEHSKGAHPNDYRYCLASLAHCYDSLGLMLEDGQTDEARRCYSEAIHFMTQVVAMEGEQPTAYPEILQQYKDRLLKLK